MLVELLQLLFLHHSNLITYFLLFEQQLFFHYPLPHKFLLLSCCFKTLWCQDQLTEYLFTENFNPSVTTIFNKNNLDAKKVIIKPIQQKITPTKMKRSILLMITDKAVGFVKFIWPYLYPMGLALAVILIVRLNNGSLTGTETKNILYYFPPKKQ